MYMNKLQQSKLFNWLLIKKLYRDQAITPEIHSISQHYPRLF